MAEIRVERLHKAFADFVAVKDSTFTVTKSAKALRRRSTRISAIVSRRWAAPEPIERPLGGQRTQ